jgi:hypothetical protein
LYDRHTGGKARDARQVSLVAPGIASGRRKLVDRSPHIGIERKSHAWRHHAHDGGRERVDANRASKDVGIGTVATRPQRVAQHHHPSGFQRVILGEERAADERTLPNEVEQARRRPYARNLFRRARLFADVHRHTLKQGASRKGAGLSPPILEVEFGNSGLAPAGINAVQRHQTVRMIEG